MSGDQAAYLLYMVLLLLVAGSALASRRLPPGKMLRMSLVWVAIFAVGILVMSLFVQS